MDIDDFIVLGKACPERLSDGRTTVCTAGYSEKLGFVRLFPTRIDSAIRRWDIIQVPVERPERDTREESWKIEGSKAEWDNLDNKIQRIGSINRKYNQQLSFIERLIDDCSFVLNEEKRSLGIIEPRSFSPYFKKNKSFKKGIQTDLFKRPLPKVLENYPLLPYMKYHCSKCQKKTKHDQLILEWGIFEWMRKNPDNIEQVWENLLLESEKHKIFFFLGNHFQYRNAFMIISILRIKVN